MTLNNWLLVLSGFLIGGAFWVWITLKVVRKGLKMEALSDVRIWKRETSQIEIIQSCINAYSYEK